MIKIGDCRASMRELIAEGQRVQMCVTSPPYFGLRDYGHPGQLGLEATPVEYVNNMVEVFRLVRELLADDGTLWLNIGDSYSNTGGISQPHRDSSGGIGNKKTKGTQPYSSAGGGFKRQRSAAGSIKPKDVIGIPWLLAFALRADGWYLRQDIIWHKPNPMPESVTDRCTKAHEYLFLLTKSERYYYDIEAVKEPADPANHRDSRGIRRTAPGSQDHTGFKDGRHYETRNRRSVWTIPTQPYAGAHFATFPPALVEPCILAGSRPGDTVLDPFLGSGTVGQVAQNLGREWIGCELNPNYLPLQRQRTAQTAITF
jgi:DNA modification methylase